MSVLSVHPTFPIFTEADGQPLENGYIWIGTANLDPQVNPIAVYWDAALTQPAVQPIRTINGYPAKSGAPGRLYVNSDYSIRVQNKNGSAIYSAPASTDKYSSELVTFLQAGANAVQRTVESKLREMVSVKDFGAVGDGVADDTVAIQSALNASKNGQILYFPAGTYIVSQPISFPVGTGAQYSSAVTLEGAAANSTISFVNGGKLTTSANSYTPSIIKALKFKSDGNVASLVTLAGAIVLSECTFIGFDTAVQVRQSNVKIEKCAFNSCDFGIVNFNQANDYTNTFAIKNCTFNNVDNPIYLLNDYPSYPTVPTNAFVPSLSSYSSSTISISDCIFEQYAENSSAIYIKNGSNIVIRDCWFETTAISPAPPFYSQTITVTNYSTNIYIDNCWTQYQISGSSGWAVKVDDNSTATIGNIRGNRFVCTNNSKLYFTKSNHNSNFFLTRDSSSEIYAAAFTRDSFGSIDTKNTQYSYSSQTVDVKPIDQTNATGGNTANSLIRWDHDTFPPAYFIGSSRSGTVGTHGAILNNNTLGAYLFGGSGATKMLASARISARAAEDFTDSAAGTNLEFAVAAVGAATVTNRLTLTSAGVLQPAADGTQSLGSASFKWSAVWASNGTIQTSDEREKQDIAELNEAEKRVAVALKGLIKKFRFKDAVASKGDAARIHVGIIAQEMSSAFANEGLDASHYGVICYDEWDEQPEVKDKNGNVEIAYRSAGSRYGVRYDELLAFIIAAI